MFPYIPLDQSVDFLMVLGRNFDRSRGFLLASSPKVRYFSEKPEDIDMESEFDERVVYADGSALESVKYQKNQVRNCIKNFYQ